MPSRVVAKVWWETPDQKPMARTLFSDMAVTFGRHKDVGIRVGHCVEFDATVPRWWGEFSWHRDRLHIANLDDNWGFDLVPRGDDASTRMSVPPQALISPPMTRFDIVAQAPNSQHVLHVLTSDVRRYLVPPDRDEADATNAPSHLPFRLTEAQRVVGKAILAGNQEGRSRRVGYDEIATGTHYSRRYVRELIQEMDLQFLQYDLAPNVGSSDSLDRVAQVLTRHPGILR